MNKKTRIKQESTGNCGIQGPGPGRPKGRKNSISKQMIADVFATYEQLGGVKYLKGLAKSKDRADRQLWGAMLAKVMPSRSKIKADTSDKLSWADIVNNCGAREAETNPTPN